MDIFAVFKLLGGVAFFLFGMSVMSSGLEKMSGGRLERTLKSATSNRFYSMALGAGITIAIQSSSALTVMLVGLVNSGIMQLEQTVGVIMGSNIGTTLTAWILSLAGIESNNIVLKLLKPENFSPLFAAVGIVMVMGSKVAKRKNVGEILLGFAVLMFGMVIMKDSVAGLESSGALQNMLTLFSNPLMGVLVGAVFTGIIQSSAASVGVLQTLSMTVGITYSMAIPIVMGQNIGTCVTALISSIGTNKNAKRVALVHIYFNIIGTVFFLILLYGIGAFVDFRFMDMKVSPASIALIHSVFNIVATVMLTPFSNMLVKLAKLTIRDKPSEEMKYAFIDERLLNTPSFAIAQCRDMVIKMGHITRETVLSAIDTVSKYDTKTAELVRENETLLDEYEDKLGTYLVKLSARELTDADSWEVSKLLHMIGDLERMGDHALNILQSAEEILEKNIEFSPSAQRDLMVAHDALRDIINMTIDAFDRGDLELARQVEPLEQVIDELVGNMRSRHILRLQSGECTMLPGFVWSDLLINYERLSDHCSNIAVCIIQIDSRTLDRHVYLSETRTEENVEFITAFNEYHEKFKLQ